MIGTKNKKVCIMYKAIITHCIMYIKYNTAEFVYNKAKMNNFELSYILCLV